jgi:hypothetical protein
VVFSQIKWAEKMERREKEDEKAELERKRKFEERFADSKVITWENRPARKQARGFGDNK